MVCKLFDSAIVIVVVSQDLSLALNFQISFLFSPAPSPPHPPRISYKCYCIASLSRLYSPEAYTVLATVVALSSKIRCGSCPASRHSVSPVMKSSVLARRSFLTSFPPTTRYAWTGGNVTQFRNNIAFNPPSSPQYLEMCKHAQFLQS